MISKGTTLPWTQVVNLISQGTALPWTQVVNLISQGTALPWTQVVNLISQGTTLPWTQVVNLISKGTTLCSYVCFGFFGCLSSQQHASVSQGRIYTDNFTCCHTEIEAADPTFHLTQSQYTDTGPTSPSADPITPGAWQGSHWSANFSVTGMTRPRKNPGASGIRTRDLPLSRRTP